MRTEHYDIIVAGCGTMGAAALYYAAAGGANVLGLEQFPGSPHVNGSHAGQSRIIRKAYFEDAAYIPLLQASYDLFAEMESLSGEELFNRCGIVYAGPSHHPVMKGVQFASEEFHIPVRSLPSFPHFENNGDAILLEADAGFVLPEKSISTFLKQATKAKIRYHEKLLNWECRNSQIKVQTDAGEYSCDKLIITAGPWAGEVLSSLNIPLKVTRQVLVWVEPESPQQFYPENFPCWMIAENDLPGVYYGFPYLDGNKYPGPSGLKLAYHHAGEETDPSAVNREILSSEISMLIDAVAVHLPMVRSKVVAAKTCLYTNTPDEHFVIDKVPGTEGRVIVACGFSGHGFKFMPAIGRSLAEMAMQGEATMPLEFFSLARLGITPGEGPS